MTRITRRSALAGIAAGTLAGQTLAANAWGQTTPLRLEKAGASRRLPDRMVGSSMMQMMENFYEEPKIAALKPLNLAYSRFPGGSMSSFYNWRTGQLDVDARPDSSPYRKAWGERSIKFRQAHPDGWKFPEYAAFCRRLGVEPVLLPNLETDTRESQAAWMKSLADQGIAPHHIELGNEFYLALENDPASVARWPDPQTAQRITKDYVGAMRPYLPKDAKLAVSCADEHFAGERAAASSPYVQRILAWNEGVANAPWFDAVTIHTIVNVARLGPAARQPASTPAEAQAIFDLLVAHWDAGVKRSTSALSARFPGKEVWMTEWNPRQGIPLQGNDTVTQAMEMHAMTRAHLAMLQVPAVTLTTFQMMSFDQNSPYRVFVPDGGGGWSPYPVTMALGWLATAINGGGVDYQRWIEPGGQVRPGGGVNDDSYAVVEAALFSRRKGATLIIQNAGPRPRSLDLAGAGGMGPPDRIETLSLPDLVDEGRRAAQPRMLASAPTIELPAYSVTRAAWS